MAGNTANPRIWLGADTYTAPLGTAAPTDLATAWAAAWKPLGLLGEDGASEERDQDSNDFFAWGGILIRTVRSKHKRTFTVTALEDNPTVYTLTNPGSTQATALGVTTRTVKVPGTDIRAFGLELLDGTVKKRKVIPRGEVVEVGSVTLAETDLTAFALTIAVYPAADLTLYTELTDDPAAVVV